MKKNITIIILSILLVASIALCVYFKIDNSNNTECKKDVSEDKNELDNKQEKSDNIKSDEPDDNVENDVPTQTVIDVNKYKITENRSNRLHMSLDKEYIIEADGKKLNDNYEGTIYNYELTEDHFVVFVAEKHKNPTGIKTVIYDVITGEKLQEFIGSIVKFKSNDNFILSSAITVVQPNYYIWNYKNKYSFVFLSKVNLTEDKEVY